MLLNVSEDRRHQQHGVERLKSLTKQSVMFRAEKRVVEAMS